MDTSKIRKDAFAEYKSKWKPAVIMCAIYMGVSFIVSLLASLIPVVGSLIALAYFVITVPLAYGLSAGLWKVYNSENVSPTDFFSIGFANFKRAWVVALRVLLKVIVPTIIFVVGYVLILIGSGMGIAAAFGGSVGVAGAGIALIIIGTILAIVGGIWEFIASLHYILAVVLAIDTADDPKTCVEKSKELMKEKRGKFFTSIVLPCIGLSFLVGIVTGIFSFNSIVQQLVEAAGTAIILPFILLGTFVFYRAVEGGPVEASKVEVKEEPKEVVEPVTEEVAEPITEDKKSDDNPIL